MRDFFVENYDWRTKGETAYNHTYEKLTKDQKLIDYGKWNVNVTKEGKLYMQPTVATMCGAGMPVHFQVKTMCFPQNDRHDQTWTYYADSVYLYKDG